MSHIPDNYVVDIISKFFDRSAAARNSGGIAAFELMYGRPLPPGYWYDPVTCYWLPACVTLLPMERLQRCR